jgi:hypothetical protein
MTSAPNLQAVTQEVRRRIERVISNLEPITQERDPIIQDPRRVWLEITLSIVELESAVTSLKNGWWP